MPKVITGVRIRPRTKAARLEWEQKENELLSQTTLAFMKPPKKLDFPEVDFMVSWECDDTRCKGHEMGLKTWGLHELYRKIANDPQRTEKTLAKMNEMLDQSKRDVFLFLGTFVGLRFEFGLMDSYCPARNTQLELL